MVHMHEMSEKKRKEKKRKVKKRNERTNDFFLYIEMTDQREWHKASLEAWAQGHGKPLMISTEPIINVLWHFLKMKNY